MSLAPVRLVAGTEAEIRRLAAAAYPHEGCGVLIGSSSAEGVLVRDVTSGHNLWSQRLRDRYDLDPADIRAADASARSRGLDVVGFWHSHPDHPAWPSQFDSERAWADYAYLIVNSHDAGTGDLNAFGLDGEAQGLRPVGLVAEGP